MASEPPSNPPKEESGAIGGVGLTADAKDAAELERDQKLAAALIEAIKNNDAHTVKVLLKETGANANALDSNGKTALETALYYARGLRWPQNDRILSYLITAGAKLDMPPGLLNELLFVVANNGMMKSIKALHDRGVDLSVQLKMPPDLTLEQEFMSRKIFPMPEDERRKQRYIDLFRMRPPYRETHSGSVKLKKLNVLDVAVLQKQYYAAKLLQGYGVKGFDSNTEFSITSMERSIKEQSIYTRDNELKEDPAKAHKLAKYLIHSKEPLCNLSDAPAHTVFEIIASRVYVEDPKQRKEILEIIRRLSENPCHQVLMQTLAVYFLNNKRANIIFINSPITEYQPLLSDEHGGTKGYYNQKNTLVIDASSGRKFDEIRGTTIHEIGHFIRNIVHRNGSQPYPEDDNEKAKLFEDAIRASLLNIQQILPEKIPLKTEPALGTYFMAKELLRIPRTSDEAFLGWTLNRTGLDDAVKRVITLVAETYNYKMVSEHREFVVRYNQLQEELGANHPALKLIEPIYEYIQKIEVPLFNAYVEKSKRKHEVIPIDAKLRVEDAHLTAGPGSGADPGTGADEHRKGMPATPGEANNSRSKFKG